MRRVQVKPWRKNARIREFSQNIESEIPYKVDFSESATDRGTSVSSISWTSKGSQYVTISNKTLDTGVATADVSGQWRGWALVKVVATYADGNTESQYIKIQLTDPEML